VSTTRALGGAGLRVSALGLGCQELTGEYGAADPDEAVATVHKALDLGVTLFDTAEGYGPYRNEAFLGSALRGRRAGAVIATKVGFAIRDGRTAEPDSRPERIRTAVEGSLQRLRTDHVDLLYQHRVDPRVPIEDVVGAMADLVGAGKVRYIGLSEAGESTIRRAHAIHPLSAVQSEYSLWERGLEARIIPVLRELGIGLVPFAPLGRGFLAGTARRAEEYGADDYRRHDPRLRGPNYDANARIAAVVGAVARGCRASPAQVALAWLLQRGDDIVPIPGTKRRAHLEDNVRALDLELSPQDVAGLEKALPPGTTVGARYPEHRMALVER
jgi:aryl-alcohol dehydrogenase-like predicted oxidoreductase